MTNDEYQQLIEFLGRKFEEIDRRFETMDRRLGGPGNLPACACPHADRRNLWILWRSAILFTSTIRNSI